MVGIDNSDQYIDWWHEKLDSTGLDHVGTLSAVVFSPSITIGLSDYINITYSQTIGHRYMTYENDDGIHHRDEGSNTDFDNANGGLLGDGRVTMRLLALNDGRGSGNRLFLGAGLGIPSKNALTSDPFFLDGTEKTRHRHFSMSEGAYKGFLELQYFRKRMKNPVFIGGTFTIETPLDSSQYGFKPSTMFDLSLIALTNKAIIFGGTIGTSVMFRHSTASYWHEIEAPNSRATTAIPGVGFLWNLGFGTLALNIQKPLFIDGSFSGIESETKQEVHAWQFSISMRRILDYNIPWLYW